VRESDKRPDKVPGTGDVHRKIAEGNNVDLHWLVSGRGAPRRTRLTALEVVLAEREWSPAARAAAKAARGARTAEQWRSFLMAVEAAEATPDPPSTGVRPSSSGTRAG
jgi:hypothetical protein